MKKNFLAAFVLLGYCVIAGINLAGNIALLVPLGVLARFVYRNLTWKAALALALVAPDRSSVW